MSKFSERSKNRILYLDVIRVLSMILVMIYHFSVHSYEMTPWFYRPMEFYSEHLGLNIAKIGVSLFFILSGASLGISKKPFKVKEFYKNRIIRIFPSYYIVWILAFLAVLLFFRNSLIYKRPITLIFTVVGLDGYLLKYFDTWYYTGEWFLGCLIILYVLYPLFRLIMEKMPKLFFGIVMVAYVVALILLPESHDYYSMFVFRIPELVMGMYLIRYWEKVRFSYGIAGLAISVFLIFLPFEYPKLMLARAFAVSLGLYIFIASLSPILQPKMQVALLRRNGRSPDEDIDSVGDKIRAVILTPVVFLSNISYEIFLIHHFTIVAIFTIFFFDRGLSAGSAAAVFAGWFAAVVLASFIVNKISSVIQRKLKK